MCLSVYVMVCARGQLGRGGWSSPSRCAMSSCDAYLGVLAMGVGRVVDERYEGSIWMDSLDGLPGWDL